MSEIALVDCNNFFASCEQLMNPNLLNKPLCVLSNNDGCVVARSKEAKALGISMGMPYFMAKKQFPQAIYTSGHMHLYQEISHRVMAKLSSYTPMVEAYSIDEAFLELSGLKKLYRMSYNGIIEMIQEEIMNEVGIPVSIGLASTKTLAKLACEKGKTNTGLYRIGRWNLDDELKRTAIEEIWGVGRNTAALFHKYGIYKASDIVKQNEFWLKKIWGKRGVELKQELLGESVYPVDNKPALPKSIQKTSSFAHFTSDKFYIKNSLHYHAHLACSKLRRLGLKAEILCIMLRTKDFQVITEKVVLPGPTDSELTVNSYADKMLEKIYRPDIIYRSSGVYVEKLTEKNASQLYLFDTPKNQKAEKLAQVWDKIEHKYGKGSFSIGALNPKKED